MNLDALAPLFEGIWASFRQVFIFIRPFLQLGGIMFSSTVILFALPAFFVPREKISFQGIFLSSLYAHWLGVFRLIPFLGEVIAALGIPIFMVIALRRLYNLPIPSAIFCLFIPGFFMVFLVFATALIFGLSVFIWSQSAGVV